MINFEESEDLIYSGFISNVVIYTENMEYSNFEIIIDKLSQFKFSGIITITDLKPEFESLINEKLIYSTHISYKDFLEKYELKNAEFKSTTCSLPFTTIFIKENGEVMACPNLLNIIWGNALNASWSDLQNNLDRESFQNLMYEKGRLELPSCNKCKFNPNDAYFSLSATLLFSDKDKEIEYDDEVE